jgi:D-alanine-D-alanine ligase-like ATP-grasp enzyme
MKNIAIIMGGYSSEYKISLISGISCTTIWIKQNTRVLRPYTQRKVGLRGRNETEYRSIK